MKLVVKRFIFGPKATLGKLTIDSEDFWCYTLEDVVRPMGEKIQNETAIPFGTYEVVLDMSKRFGKIMPHILNVPGFDGVRIHSGNSDLDVEGCIALGYDHINDDWIGRSREAFRDFFMLLKSKIDSGEKITLEILHG